jgi:hypothetical protein
VGVGGSENVVCPGLRNLHPPTPPPPGTNIRQEEGNRSSGNPYPLSQDKPPGRGEENYPFFLARLSTTSLPFAAFGWKIESSGFLNSTIMSWR